MAWSFSQNSPVYFQIAERITKWVLSGDYQPGEQLPSVRQLALEAAVNPNTVQHAFSELENDGIIVSKGTVGRYVTEDVEVIELCRRRMLLRTVKEFTQNLTQLSVSKEQIISMIEEVMQDEHPSV